MMVGETEQDRTGQDTDNDSDKMGWCLLSRGGVAGSRATSGCFGDIAALSLAWQFEQPGNLAAWQATQRKTTKTPWKRWVHKAYSDDM